MPFQSSEVPLSEDKCIYVHKGEWLQYKLDRPLVPPQPIPTHAFLQTSIYVAAPLLSISNLARVTVTIKNAPPPPPPHSPKMQVLHPWKMFCSQPASPIVSLMQKNVIETRIFQLYIYHFKILINYSPVTKH